MLTILAIALLTSVVAVGAGPHRKSVSESSLPCMAPRSESADWIHSINENPAGADSSSIRWRNAFGLAGVDSVALTVVSDTLVCTSVTLVVDSVFHEPASTTAYLVVLRAGPRYTAFAPSGQSQSLFK